MKSILLLSLMMPLHAFADCMQTYEDAFAQSENLEAVAGLSSAVGVTSLFGITMVASPVTTTSAAVVSDKADEACNADCKLILSILKESSANKRGGVHVAKLTHDLFVLDREAVVKSVLNLNQTDQLCANGEVLSSYEEFKTMLDQSLSN